MDSTVNVTSRGVTRQGVSHGTSLILHHPTGGVTSRVAKWEGGVVARITIRVKFVSRGNKQDEGNVRFRQSIE